MIVVGLTGSIAMGKSTTARLFADAGVPVFDSDACVHALYSPGGAALAPIAALWPAAVTAHGVDRQILSAAIASDPALLAKIEAVVHPLVKAEQTAFLTRARAARVPFAILDIPLLFETGRDRSVDKVIVVSAPPELQRQRALERPGMTAEKFDMILHRQLPDAEKRARADYIVDSSKGIDDARRQVGHIITDLSRFVGKPS